MKLKFMTWNVENLFPVNVEAGPKTQEAYNAKLAAVVKTIKTLNPAVLALQEIGDLATVAMPRPLTDLLARLEVYDAVVSKAFGDRGIRVAVLTRRDLVVEAEAEVFALDARPPLRFQGMDGEPLTTMSRGAVCVRLDVQGRRIHVLTAHLKSKLLTYPNHRFNPIDEDERVRAGALALSRRTAEAATLRLAVTKLLATGDDLVLMGDLNDGADAQTTELLYGPGGSQPPGKGFDTHDVGDPQRLFNVTRLIAPERRYSRVFEGKKELIDHILMSAGFFPQVDAAHKRQAVTVDSHVDYAGDGLDSVNDDPSARRGRPSSDHAPVTAEVELP